MLFNTLEHWIVFFFFLTLCNSLEHLVVFFFFSFVDTLVTSGCTWHSKFFSTFCNDYTWHGNGADIFKNIYVSDHESRVVKHMCLQFLLIWVSNWKLFLILQSTFFCFVFFVVGFLSEFPRL
jgi:hypothetical protein